MKTREQWIDEAELFISEMESAGAEITPETVLEEVKAGWSDEVNFDGTPEEYADELMDYIKKALEATR